MTSSFQSTAFQSSARPVDTFVAPPSVQPKTGIEELASALATVNPAIQKLIPGFIEKDIEKEERKGAYAAIKKDLESGVVNKLATKARKGEGGEDLANAIIGGSPAFKQGYAKQRSLNSLLKIENFLDTESKKKQIDVLDKDGNPTGKTKPLYAFPLGSSEVQDFLNGITSTFIDDISPDVDEETMIDVVFPKLQEKLANFNTDFTKQHNAYNKNLILAESTKRIKENSKIFLKAQTFGFRNPEAKTLAIEGLKEDFKQLDLDMRNAGITGPDATKFNETVIDNILSLGQLAVTQGNFDYAAQLVNFLGDSIPGSSQGKSLKDNPKWTDKTTDFFFDLYVKEGEIKERDYKLEKINRRNRFTTRIEDYRNEKDLILKSQKYEKLKLDFQEKEYQTDIDEFGVLDNKPFNEKINKLLKDITRGVYFVDGEPDKGSAYLELDKIEKDNLTPDSETEAQITKINNAIKEMKSYTNDLSKYEDDIMQEVKQKLKQPSGPFRIPGLSNKDAALSSRYRRILEDEADQAMADFVTENGRPMTRLEVKKMYRTLEDYIFLDVGIINDDEIQTIPEVDAIGPGMNPFSKAKRKEKKQNQQNLQNNEILKDDSFDLPQVIQPGATSEVTQADIDREKALDAEEANSYIVQAGDTLTSIAESFGTTINDIMETNNITNADLINIGQQLNMPQESIEEPQINFSDDTRVQSIVTSANELGISPIALAAVIAQESSFRPTVVSVDKATGKKYTGLIQFGPYEIAKYKIKPNMTFEEQMVAVTSFLRDRGVRPGDGAKEIYAAIFTGNVSNLDKGGADWADSNGTTVNKALPNLLQGGSKYKMAVDFLQQIGTYSPKSN